MINIFMNNAFFGLKLEAIKKKPIKNENTQ